MAVTGDLKWRHDLKDIEAMAASQAAILQSAARLLKPGGRLVLSIKSGERIHTENSYKYTLAGMSALLQNAGFTQTAAGPIHKTGLRCTGPRFTAPIEGLPRPGCKCLAALDERASWPPSRSLSPFTPALAHPIACGWCAGDAARGNAPAIDPQHG